MNNSPKDYIARIDELKESFIEDLTKLISIDSAQGEPAEGAPFGKGVKEVYDCIMAMGSREGFECVDIDGYGGHMDYKADENSTDEKIMGILGHMDVVPAGNEWTYDPFGAEIIDGTMYGRGTLDDKGPTLAAFYAMKALKDCGYKPQRTVRMVIGLDEETGSTGMEYYKERVKMPDYGFTPDSDFPLIHCEMGIMTFDFAKKFDKPANGGFTLKKITGGQAHNMVPDEAQAVIANDEGYDLIKEKIAEYREATGYDITSKGRGKSLAVTVKGKSAHGAMPWKGTNAISVLMEFLGRIEFNSRGVNDFIEFYNTCIGFDVRGEKLGCGLEDEISGKLILNTGVIAMDTESFLTCRLF